MLPTAEFFQIEQRVSKGLAAKLERIRLQRLYQFDKRARSTMSQLAKIPYRGARNPDHGLVGGARFKSTSEYANGITCHGDMHGP